MRFRAGGALHQHKVLHLEPSPHPFFFFTSWILALQFSNESCLGTRGVIKEQDKVSYAPNAQCPLQLNPLYLQEAASFTWVLIPYAALVRRRKQERRMALKAKQKPVAPSFLSVDINQHTSRLCLEAGKEVREKTQKRRPRLWHSIFFFFLTKGKGFLLQGEPRI